jgi:hypothetical protein
MSYTTTDYKNNNVDIGSYFCDLTNNQTIGGIKTFSSIPKITTNIDVSTNNSNIATTAFVKLQNYITGLTATNLGAGTLATDVLATTQPAATNNTTIATTAFVNSQINNKTKYVQITTNSAQVTSYTIIDNGTGNAYSSFILIYVLGLYNSSSGRNYTREVGYFIKDISSLSGMGSSQWVPFLTNNENGPGYTIVGTNDNTKLSLKTDANVTNWWLILFNL